ncbi:MAG: GNAT family N-acetyltransferase, partial [Candidatus Acidiferrales bacterium]
MPGAVSNQMIVEPVTLTGEHVQLVPMSAAHRGPLAEVGLDEELWRWIPDPVHTREEMFAYVDAALAQQASGVSLPFTIVERASGKVIGSTRYANIERAHRRVE